MYVSRPDLYTHAQSHTQTQTHTNKQLGQGHIHMKVEICSNGLHVEHAFLPFSVGALSMYMCLVLFCITILQPYTMIHSKFTTVFPNFRFQLHTYFIYKSLSLQPQNPKNAGNRKTCWAVVNCNHYVWPGMKHTLSAIKWNNHKN